MSETKPVERPIPPFDPGIPYATFRVWGAWTDQTEVAVKNQADKGQITVFYIGGKRMVNVQAELAKARKQAEIH